MGALSPPLRENERNIMSIRTVLILSALALSVVAITAEVPEEVEFADSKTVFNRNGLSFLQSQWSTRRRTICHHGRTNYCQKHNAHQNRNQYCGRSCPHRVTDNSCTCCCMNHREFAAAKARHNANKRGARRRRTYRAPSRASPSPSSYKPVVKPSPVVACRPSSRTLQVVSSSPSHLSPQEAILFACTPPSHT